MDMISENFADLAIGALAILGVGLVVSRIILQRLRSTGPAGQNPDSDAVPDLSDGRADDERVLIDTLIWIVESADVAIAEKARRTLNEIGVQEVVVSDVRFDPDRFRIVSTMPNENTEDGWVVSTIRPGWADGGSTIRFVDVAVAKGDD